MDSLNAQFTAGPPFVGIDVKEIGSTGQAIYEGFINYIKALTECLTDKMPRIVVDAERLSNDAERVKDRA